MQNIIRLFLILFLCGVTLYAQDKKFISSISLVGFAMDYREYDRDGVILDSEISNASDIVGFDMKHAYMFLQDDIFTHKLVVSLLNVAGKTVYTGSYIGSTDGYGSLISSTFNYVSDVAIAYENNYKISNKLEFISGFGVGYYFWYRELSAYQSELYEWLNLRVKIGAKYILNKRFSLSPSLTYKYALNPIMTASNPTLEFSLGSVKAVDFIIPMVYTLNEKIDFIGEVVFEHQKIEASNVVKGYYEPDSTSNNQYIKFGVAFKY
jgi:hypothetical protein